MSAVFFLLTSIIIAICSFLWAHRFVPRSWVPVWLHAVLALITELVGLRLAVHSLDTTAIYNAYVTAELVLLGGFGCMQLPAGMLRRLGFACGGLALTWNLSFFIRGESGFFGLAFLVNCIFFTALYLLLILLLQGQGAVGLFRQPLLYLCIGLVVYFGCDIPYFSLRSSLTKHDPQLNTALHIFINNILASLRYLLTAFAFLLFFLNRDRLRKDNP